MPDTSRIEDLKRRVQSDPASIAFAALAEEYRRAGQYEDAIATCRSGLQRHPAYLSARVTLGRALLEIERLDEARQELEYVLKVAPENLAAIRGLAEIHHRRGELPEEQHYKAALEAAQRETHVADHHAAPHHAASPHATPHRSVPHTIPVQTGSAPAPAAAPVAAAVPKAPKAPAAVAARSTAAPAAAPAPAPPPVIQPVRVQQSAATPAPVPAADPALAGLEAFLSAILRARKDLESTSLRS